MAAHAAAALSQDAGVESTLPQAGPRPLAPAALTPPTAPDWGLALGISTADFAARAFTRDPDSLKNVRRFVRETITAWGLDAFADDMTTVVNELTTNAVQHALTEDDETRGKAWLGMARTGGAVVCAVADPSPAPPSPQLPADLAQAGRGLLIVDSLTSQWGYAKTSPAGKTVWARILAPGR